MKPLSLCFLLAKSSVGGWRGIHPQNCPGGAKRHPTISIQKVRKYCIQMTSFCTTNPEYSLEGLMLKLKLQYLATWRQELTHWKRHWCWERLKAKRDGQQKMRCLDNITESMDMILSKLREIMEDREAWHAAVLGLTKCRTWLSDRATPGSGDLKMG